MERLYELKAVRKNQLDDLRETNREIQRLVTNIQNRCQHEWIYERERNMYGEIFIYCKHCKKGE